MPDVRRKISEAEAEKIIDRRVWRTLATDRAYIDAEDSEAQAQRERDIEAEIARRVSAEYDVDGWES